MRTRSCLLSCLVCLMGLTSFTTLDAQTQPNETKQDVGELKEGVKLSRQISVPNRLAVDFPDAPPTKQMKILGNCEYVPFNTWVYTGLTVKKNDTLYIKSRGIVGYVGKSGSQPDGLGRTYSPSLMPRLSFVSLVGRAGDELLTNELIVRDGDPQSQHDELFGRGFVGSEFRWTKKRSNWGKLYLAVNDSADGDNSGAYDVSIWIVRDGKVLTEADMPKPKVKAPVQIKDNASH